MEIHRDTMIRTKFHPGFERSKPVSEIVIHGTGGGGTLRYVRMGGRAEEYHRGVALFHYLIERDGTITEIIDPRRWVYHSSRGKADENTIGIELENLDFGNLGDYEAAQYRSLLWLIFEHLMKEYPSIDVIMSHSRSYEKYNGKKKTGVPCPGPEFEWNIVEDEMISRGYMFEHDRRYESYWHIRA